VPVETAADRAVFVDADEFGVTASYAPAGGSTTTDVAGIFASPQLDLFAEGSEAPGMEANAATFLCPFASLPTDAHDSEGDILEVPGTWQDMKGARSFVPDNDGADVARFVVRRIDPDGTGFATLTLSEVEEDA